MSRPAYFSKLTFVVPTPRASEHFYGVRLSAEPHPPATVITIGGEIDAYNADYVSDYLAGFVRLGHPLVLDLSGVDFLGVAGFRAVLHFGAERRRADLHWALVTSDAVNILLRITANDRPLPVVETLTDALQRLTVLVPMGMSDVAGNHRVPGTTAG